MYISYIIYISVEYTYATYNHEKLQAKNIKINDFSVLTFDLGYGNL